MQTANVGRAILRDEVDFAHSHWRRITPSAKHFISMCLRKDPAARPTAKQVGLVPQAETSPNLTP